jgi:hypothetical protein
MTWVSSVEMDHSLAAICSLRARPGSLRSVGDPTRRC